VANMQRNSQIGKVFELLKRTFVTIYFRIRAIFPHCDRNYILNLILDVKKTSESLHFFLGQLPNRKSHAGLIKRRNFHGPSRGRICCKEDKSVYHHLVQCHLISSLWHMALSLMEVRWVQPSKIKDVLVASRKRMKNVGFQDCSDSCMGVRCGNISECRTPIFP